ncbi:hypothetical protein KEC55_05195 [Burkholderia cepacia]|uniref:hypothetical protein n=1 Tax=Burkholderia cepacia TaxID=292 RepID=UPI00249E36F0|nr:hypothetical protein [Burkholderia cepacia]WGY69391.1 hypothetical protein KEC55_05195 [Burkholderia cepacia]
MKVGEEENRNGADSTGTAARIGFRVLRAATLEALRRGDEPNKKSARRGTEHKTFSCCGSGDAGTDRCRPACSNRQINT